MRPTLRSGLACLPVLLAACSVGPDYDRPSAPVSSTFKEEAGWKTRGAARRRERRRLVVGL